MGGMQPISPTCSGNITMPITQEEATARFLELVAKPITPGILPTAKLVRCRPRRPVRAPAIASRRSYRLMCKRNLFPEGDGGVMKQARQLGMSKRGLAIPERGESKELRIKAYTACFDKPLTTVQIDALTALARVGKGCRTALPATT